MALANIAELFFRKNLNVLMIDWDLEAPGLERFFYSDTEVRRLQDRPGVLDMILAHKRRLAAPISKDDELFEQISKYWNVVRKSDWGNELRLITAGKRDGEDFDAYANEVRSFDWKDLYDNWAGEVYFEQLRLQASLSADIVLIDSRTGVTEMGGVCTYHLADSVVMFCAPNDQNLDGTMEMAKRFARDEVEPYRGGRRLQTVIIPSRVHEHEESQLLQDFHERFIKALTQYRTHLPEIFDRSPNKLWEMYIPYRAAYAFRERLAATDPNTSYAQPVLEKYEKITDCLIQLDSELQAKIEANQVISAETRSLQAIRQKRSIKAFISGTSRDLTEYREQASIAVIRAGFDPVMYETFTASPLDAFTTTLQAVESADIYIGIIAFRYGAIPEVPENPERLSMVELEYQRARDLGLLCLIFMMTEGAPVNRDDIEQNLESTAKLQRFKNKLLSQHVVSFFSSPDELRTNVTNSLLNPDCQKLLLDRISKQINVEQAKDLIPHPPSPYIAHPYTLLGSAGLIGRTAEFNALKNWVSNSSSSFYTARVLALTALGGMGKTALAWQWFNENASREMTPFAGSMWWSFYESSSSFESFISQALAYTLRMSSSEIEKLSRTDRETRLLQVFDREAYLIVLDGVERLLVAYARMDTSKLADDDAGHSLRRMVDPRDANFLRRLLVCKSVRVLLTTRLFPADLQDETGSTLSGARRIVLSGLNDDDAIDLWRSFGVSGSRDKLLQLFKQFGNLPLLISILAGTVKSYRRAPGDFDRWLQANPDFDLTPDLLSSADRKSHILQNALQGLSGEARRTLEMVAAFRKPVGYDALAVLLVGKEKLFLSETNLDTALTDLEDRGLMGWDRASNRYDVHPIVKAVVWTNLTWQRKVSIYSEIEQYFVPMVEALPSDIEGVDDLTPAIELFGALVNLKRFDDAFSVYQQRLGHPLMFQFSAASTIVELLTLFFPNGLEAPSILVDEGKQEYVLSQLATASSFNGMLSQAIQLGQRFIEMAKGNKSAQNLSVGYENLSRVLLTSGRLYEAERTIRLALQIASSQDSSRRVLMRSHLEKIQLIRNANVDNINIAGEKVALKPNASFESLADQAEAELLKGNLSAARGFADSAFESTMRYRAAGQLVRVERIRGEIALAFGDLKDAQNYLQSALVRARTINLVAEELPALIGLAELNRRCGEHGTAREFLDDVWNNAERGSFVLAHADALNVLVQIERDSANIEKAADAATRAYRAAWCDGISIDEILNFSYWRALQIAKNHLDAIGLPYPTLPPFDPSRAEPMPSDVL